MIQDIYPQKLNNSYRPSSKVSDESIVVIHKDGKLLLKVDENDFTIVFPRLKDLGDKAIQSIYLFEISDEE